jgi:hypothetical protein
MKYQQTGIWLQEVVDGESEEEECKVNPYILLLHLKSTTVIRQSLTHCRGVYRAFLGGCGVLVGPKRIVIVGRVIVDT